MTVPLGKTSGGRWKPLFKFVSLTATPMFDDALTSRSTTSLLGSGDGGGMSPESGGSTDCGQEALQPWREAPAVTTTHAPSKKGVLSPTHYPSARFVGEKIKFRDALVTEVVEPPARGGDDDDEGEDRSYARIIDRRSTGFTFDLETDIAEHSDDEQEPCRAQQRRHSGASLSSGFSSDDEFEMLERLAADNAKVNKEATRLRWPAGPMASADEGSGGGHVAPPGAATRCVAQSSSLRAGDSGDTEATPCGPPTGAGTGVCSPTPAAARAAVLAPRRRGQEDERSSFASSSDEEVPAKAKLPTSAKPSNGFVAYFGPSGELFGAHSQVMMSVFPGKPAAHADCETSSFGSSEGEGEN